MADIAAEKAERMSSDATKAAFGNGAVSLLRKHEIIPEKSDIGFHPA
ncbi:MULTISPECIES: hypothetical protein [unclassified Mesorhizobium]|nr:MULTISPECIES: hypothetical protein [unclassified Mesorhizobium]